MDDVTRYRRRQVALRLRGQVRELAAELDPALARTELPPYIQKKIRTARDILKETARDLDRSQARASKPPLNTRSG